MAQVDDAIEVLIKTEFSKKGIDEANKTLQRFGATVKQYNNKLALTDTVSKRIMKDFTELQKREEHAARSFQFQGLNLLFFGMAISRTFGGILKSSTDTFTGIMESTEGTSTAIGTLNAATEYLNFTLGDALNTVLEPLLPVLLDIVGAIANFVQEHPEVTWGLIAAAIAGISLTAIGVLSTFFQNFGKGSGGMHSDWSTFFSSTGGLSRLEKFAGGAIGMSLIISGFQKLDGEEFLKGLGDMTAGTGMLVIASGKKSYKSGAILLGIGAALQVADVLLDKEFTFDKLRSVLSQVGIYLVGAGLMMGPAGLPLLAIGAALTFNDVLFGDQFIEKLSSVSSWIKWYINDQMGSPFGADILGFVASKAGFTQAQQDKVWNGMDYVGKQVLAPITGQGQTTNNNVTVVMNSTGNSFVDGQTAGNETCRVLNSFYGGMKSYG